MNYFALEPLLLAQLAAACPSIGTVSGLPDVFSLAQQGQHAKPTVSAHHPVSNPTGQKHGAVHVMFWDETVTKSTGDCDHADQTWLIAVVSSNVTDKQTGTRAREENGWLVDQVLTALRRWDYGLLLPANQVRPRQYLHRITPPIHRNQVLQDDNGRVTTFLAYTAKNIIV